MEDVEFVTSDGSEFEVAFPKPYRKRLGYVQGIEILVFETRDAISPHLRVEFTPLIATSAHIPDMRAMLESYSHLAGLVQPEITLAQDPLGRVGTYSGIKTAAGVEMRVYGKVTLGERSMVSCTVVEPLADFPSTDSTFFLGSVRRKKQ